MSRQIHLAKGLDLRSLYTWCGYHSHPLLAVGEAIVFEPLHADCEACLEARSMAAHNVKPAVADPEEAFK